MARFLVEGSELFLFGGFDDEVKNQHHGSQADSQGREELESGTSFGPAEATLRPQKKQGQHPHTDAIHSHHVTLATMDCLSRLIPLY